MYRESQIDKENTKWFENNKTVNSLTKLTISNGSIRGVTPCSIEFKYPITVICGENGAGKSTILALASCAFHNTSSFIPQNRVRPNASKERRYYTYGDFFTFSPEETGITEIEICAEYLTKEGSKQNIRKKKPSGKWNDFNRRPERAVAYLGINRIVPPSESNPHRHYSRKFSSKSMDEDKLRQLKESMSAVIGRNYSDIDLMAYNTYRLFEAKRNGLTYTGFNMGAGENAVLGLLLEILSAGKGALIVVDEIELGLHTQAQMRLISELKNLCIKYNCQIICSSHSKDILSCVPPKGRVFLKRTDASIDIIPEISPEYAFGKLSGTQSNELTVFVEDEVGKGFLEALLPQNIRERIRIITVGSDQAVLKHMAVHYREHDDSFVAFLDGDKRTQKESSISKIRNHLESRIYDEEEEFRQLMDERLQYLPGYSWPERLLVEEAMRSEHQHLLEEKWGCPVSEIIVYLEEALAAGKHNEFYAMSKKICLPENQVRADIMGLYKKDHQNEADAIATVINSLFT